MKTMRITGVGILLTLMTSMASAQVTFSVDSLELLPVTGNNACVQVGIYIENQDENWGGIAVRLEYTDPQSLLAGAPSIITTFNPNSNPAIALNGDGSESIGGCLAGDVFNVFNDEDGAAPGITSPTALAALANAADLGNVESVAGGVVSFRASSITNTIVASSGKTLIAIVEFPLTAGAGNGQIGLNFVDGMSPDVNLATPQATGVGATPALTDGTITVFDDADCDNTNFTTFADVLSGDSAATNGDTTFGLDFLDPALGGIGGNISMTVNYGGNVSGFQITGSDGYDSGFTAVDGTSPDAMTISTQGDASPATNTSSVTYTVTYFVADTLDLDMDPGTTDLPGDSCTVTATWNPAQCNAFWTNTIPGANGTMTVELTNAIISGDFGTVTGPGGTTLTSPVALVTPESVSGSTATFEAYNENVALADAGDYVVSDFGGPGSVIRGVPSCVATLGFTCVSNLVATVDTATIGSPLTGTMSADDESGFSVVYNSVSTDFPAETAAYATGNNANGSFTSVTITANGPSQDGNGDPCAVESETLPITFDAPVCGVNSVVAAGPRGGSFDVGDPITISLTTTGAMSANMEGEGMMTAVVGTPGTDNEITWEITINANSPSETVTITNPNGVTASCDITIDLNCVLPTIVNVAPVNGSGITVNGTPGCVYYVLVSDKDGNPISGPTALPAADGSGNASDDSIVIPPDAVIEVGLDPALMFGNGSDSVVTVPTLGEWALIAFVMMLMASGVVMMRKRRLS